MKFFDRTAPRDRAAIADLRRDGVALVKNALPVETVALAAAAFRTLSSDIAQGRSPLKRAARFVSGGFLPEQLDQLPDHPALVDLVRQIIGRDVALYMNRLLVKDGTWNGPVAAHQDCPYFHGTLDKLTVFVPLEPFTAETGNLSFVNGSHRYGNLGVRGTIRYEELPHLPLSRPDALPGDIILATFSVWHFSEPATVQCDRPLLQMAYQSADDGSYFGEPDGPRLICGQWRTDAFHRFRDHITPDG